MTAASFPCSIRGISAPRAGRCPLASVTRSCPPAAQQLSPQQLCAGKAALPRPKSSFGSICRVPGFTSLSLLMYWLGTPSSPSCGIPAWADGGQTSQCQYSFPLEKVSAQHFEAMAPRPFQSKDRWKRHSGERLGQEGSWQLFGVCSSGRMYKSPKHTHTVLASNSAALRWFTASDFSGAVVLAPALLNPLLLSARCFSSSSAHCEATRLLFSSCSMGLTFLSLVPTEG